MVSPFVRKHYPIFYTVLPFFILRYAKTLRSTENFRTCKCNQRLYFVLKKEEDENKIDPYPLEKEKELVSYITVGNIVQARRVLNEIFGHIFFSSGKNFNIIKARVLELVVVLSRAAVEGGGDMREIFGMNYVFLNDIHKLNTVEELTEWLTKIMARFSDCVFNLTDIKHVDVLYRSLNYINNNYEEDNLGRGRFLFLLSPTYFSQYLRKK